MDVLKEVVIPALEEIGAKGAGPDTALMGGASAIDSLGLVSAVCAMERRVQEKRGQKIRIIPDKPLGKNSPFRNATSLAAYISTLIGGAS